VIRAMVEHLDLQYLYGGRPEVTVKVPEEILPGEMADDEEWTDPTGPEN